MNYGVTLQGFVRPTLQEIKTRLENNFKAKFGNDIVLAEDQPFGILVGILADSENTLWEGQEGSYNAFDIDNAFGNGLSDLVQINNIKRLPESATTVQLSLTGDSGTVVPAGSVCSSEADPFTGEVISVTTDSDITLISGVPVLVNATATITGVVNILANTVVKITTPLLGWDGVNNDNDGDVGELEETDVQLRARRNRSVGISATSVFDALYAAIEQVPNVKYVRIYENTQGSPLPETGQPAYSFQCVIDGGDAEDIAQAIYSKKPVGIPSFGTTVLPIIDSKGFPQSIGLTFAQGVDIFVDVTVKAKQPLSPTLSDDIKNAIVSYGKGEGTDVGFGVNEDIPVSKMNDPINRIDGVEYIDTLLVDRVSPPVKSNGLVGVNFDEISNWNVNNINVIII